MQLVHVISLIGFAFCMSVAQVFLKLGVHTAQETSGSGVASLFATLLATWEFWIAVFLTGSLVFLWSWILSIVPLSTAYPFVVLAFVFAAIIEHFLFGQALSISFFIGCTLILVGLLVILRT